MHSNLTKLSETQVRIGIVAGEEDLKPHKQAALQKLAKSLKVAGFREGKVPMNLVEKHTDPQALQTEFLDAALSDLYAKAAANENVRPVTKPEVALKKFVPFTVLEFEVVAHIIGDIKLPNYKGIKLAKKKAQVTAKDVSGVIESLQTRLAEKIEVKRAAKKSDQAWIDFKGVDAKGKPVNGADGKDYPLLIGSNTFIPGFEDNVTGMKPGGEKTFTLTFPEDYGVKALAGQKVKFTVKLNKVEEIKKPEVDEAFAAKVGPFKTINDLKNDIKKQLTVERQQEADRDFHNELVGKIVGQTTLAVPPSMVEHQAHHSLEEFKRNLTYRGQTYEEFLKNEGLSEEQYKKTVLYPQAEKQIKTSLVLSEIAKKENLSVTPEELEIRMQLLREQYKDQAMQAELEKEENRQDIASRLLTEKVLTRLETHTLKSEKTQTKQ